MYIVLYKCLLQPRGQYKKEHIVTLKAHETY